MAEEEPQAWCSPWRRGRGQWSQTGSSTWEHADIQQSPAAPTTAPQPLTPLVQLSKGLEVPGIAEGLQLLVRAACQEADEVQAVQLELQRAVELEQALPVGDGPSGKKGASEKKGAARHEEPAGMGWRGGLQEPA